MRLRRRPLWRRRTRTGLLRNVAAVVARAPFAATAKTRSVGLVGNKLIWKELTTGIYPWDIHDEGIETILDNLQTIVGCNAAYMLSLMHHEKRPPMKRMTNQQLCWNNPDSVQYLTALCADLVSSDEIDMIQTSTLLFNTGSVAEHSLLGVTLGGCFCEHCERKAKSEGLDWELIRRTVRHFADIVKSATLQSSEALLLLRRGSSSQSMLLLEYPELYEWFSFRCRSVTEFFRSMSDTIHSIRSEVDFRFNTIWPNPELAGFDVRSVAPLIDSFRICDYPEQTGDEAKVLAKGAWIADVRRQAGENVPIIAALAPRGKATVDLIKKAVKTVALSGADGLGFGFYDCATFERLKAIRTGIEEAEVTLRQ